MRARTRVLFVDDELRLRKAWEQLLCGQEDLEFVGALGSADDLVTTAARTLADIVLLDLSMPGPNPFDAMTRLAAERPDCRVIVYSGYTDREVVQKAIDAGAWGFVDKIERPSDILAAVRRVALGEVVFPGDFLV